MRGVPGGNQGADQGTRRCTDGPIESDPRVEGRGRGSRDGDTADAAALKDTGHTCVFHTHFNTGPRFDARNLSR